jgi:hypothetical protein
VDAAAERPVDVRPKHDTVAHRALGVALELDAEQRLKHGAAR